MRLLNTSTLKLHEFIGRNIPDYTILSHTWDDEEILMQDLGRPELKSKKGYLKILRCCKLAASEGWKYVWIDTCCIDKTSSAELSEAINSMYRWYQNAEVCYVYLSDVDVKGGDSGLGDSLRGSRWFTRGWTLQELLAPSTITFYDRKWTEIGTKWSLRHAISSATSISLDHIFNPEKACIAVKMSWAAKRETTRIEDEAYCLLGLFDLNMSLLYGEGTKAFSRLQHELIQSRDDDESIFAWTIEHPWWDTMLAPFPAAFARSGDIELVTNPDHRVRPSKVSKKTLVVHAMFPRSEVPSAKNMTGVFILNCKRRGHDSQYIGIELVKYGFTYAYRADPQKLGTSKFLREAGSNVTKHPELRTSPWEVLLDFPHSLQSNGGGDSSVLLRIPQLGHAMGLVHSEPKAEPMTVHPKTGGLMVVFSTSILLLFKTNASEQLFGVALYKSFKSLNVDIIHSKTRKWIVADYVKTIHTPDGKRKALQGADRRKKLLPDRSVVSVNLGKRVIEDKKYLVVDVDFANADTVPRHWNEASQTWET